MDPVKVGKFIKELRTNNNLTQSDFAQKYNVTYQAVSKWENGINLPDISLLRKMSKDYNVSLEDILDGEKGNKKNRKFILLGLLLVVLVVIVFIIVKRDKSFEFKTISTTCKEFNVSGSLAYDSDKSSIYISHINYCGGDDNTKYKNIECNLYESNNNTNIKISSCKSDNGNIKLEEYLENVELNIDNYAQTCKKYDNNSLFLEINATDENDKTTTYKVPLELNNNCPK